MVLVMALLQSSGVGHMFTVVCVVGREKEPRAKDLPSDGLVWRWVTPAQVNTELKNRRAWGTARERAKKHL